MRLEVCACYAKESWRSWCLGMFCECVLRSVRVMQRRLAGLGVFCERVLKFVLAMQRSLGGLGSWLCTNASCRVL